METTPDQITALIYRAVDDINLELTGQKLTKAPGTVLFGRDAVIDSMALVSFIVGVEEQIQNEFGLNVTLANEKAMSMERSPFKTLASLTEYVQGVLKDL